MGLVAFYVFVIYVLVFFVGQQVIGRSSRTPHTVRREAPARFILTFVMSASLAPAYHQLRSQSVYVWAIALGTLATLAGLAVSWWAQRTLGRNWVPGIGLHNKHRLVQTGPYRYVRHPLYSGIALSSVGLGVFSLSIWFLLAMAAFAGGLMIRWYAEELLLRDRFPDQYPAYAARTGAFVPKIRR